MQSYAQLQPQIGAWSATNFGLQETPYLAVYRAGSGWDITDRSRDEVPGLIDSHPAPAGMVVALGSLIPMLGIGEELCELAGAELDGDNGAKKDACADMAIFLCDYLCRENILWPIAPRPNNLETRGKESVMVALGRIYWCHIKRHQRIRGMHDPQAFHAARSEAVRDFVWHLEAYTRQACGTSLLTVLNETWNRIVSKRNWQADAKQDTTTK